MNKKLIIYTKCNNKNKLLIKIYELGISIKNIKYSNNIIEFEVNYDDYNRINKYIKSYKFNIKDNLGIYKIIDILKIKKVFILNILLFFIILYILSHTIISVNVIHSKKYIRDLVSNSLDDYGIKKFSWKKDYNEIQKIKKKILDKYPKNIEWLEIEQIGMIYKVRVEEKIVTDIKDNNTNCHIIAKNDATITKIISDRGQAVVNTNDYVKKGDILISGEIKFNDEVKNNTCAFGKIYGEVWYTVDVNLPRDYEEYKYTGKKRYNFMIDKTKIFKSRLSNYKTKKKKILSIFGYDFYLLIEKEIKIDNKKYNEKDGVNKALELAINKMKMNLVDNERIINQKVLKKSINNSTIYVEVFVSVEQLISEQITYVKEEKEVE